MNRGNMWKLAATAILVLLVGGQARAETPNAQPRARPVSLLQHEPALDATFSMGFAPDGSAWTEVTAGELKVDKWVTAAGQASIELNYRKDRVLFRLTADGYRVSRGKKSASFLVSDQNDNRRDAARGVLVGSPAIRAFRAFTAALERRTGEDSAATISTMLDGALVATLDGDDGAAERIGRRATRQARTNVRPAVVGQMFNDCVGMYERSVVWAFNEYQDCLDLPNATFWWSLMYTPYCSAEYFLRAQQYIFQFISCMAIP